MTDKIPVGNPNKKDEQKPDAAQEAQNDSNVRVGDFLKRYGELVKELDVDFASYPVFVPDGQGGFRTIVQNTPVDVRNQPKPSPFVPQ